MAADVRNEETESEIGNTSIFSELPFVPLSDISADSDFQNGNIPSYVIVHQQMRDIVEFQKEAAEQRIQNNVESLNDSRNNLNATIECQAKSIKDLKSSIEIDYVPKAAYFELEQKFREEQEKKINAEAQLVDALENLDTSQKALSSLSLQCELEKSAFEKCCDALRDDVQELKTKNRELKSVIAEQSKECDELASQILLKQQEFNQLKNKQEAQKVRFQNKFSESEVEKQQEAYLRQMEHERLCKRNRFK